MNENTFDIVNFIEKNPLSRLSNEYDNSLINNVKEQFTDAQQQFFVTNFYTHLNYNKNDFIINLDDIWKWIGFSRKDPAKRLLDKFFVKNIDYIIVKQNIEKNQHGGQNKETILLTINCFRKFCLKADTKKADEIQDYYVKLETLIYNTLLKETNELREELEIKRYELIEQKINHKNELKQNKDKILLDTFKGKKCVYIGEIEEGRLIKIGSTKDNIERKKCHKKTYGNFIYLEIFQCDNFRDVEESILQDPIIKKNLYRQPINGHISQEVILLSENFNYEQLIYIFKKHLSQVYYLSPEQLLEKQKYDIEEKKLILETKKLELELEKIKFIYNNKNNIKLNNKNDNKNLNNDDENLDDHNNKNLDDNDKIINDNDEIIDDNDEIIDDNDEIIDDDNEIIDDDNEIIDNDEIIDDNIKKYNRKPLGRKIQKIDQNNINNIIKVYDSMAYAIKADENKNFNRSGIQDAIKYNRPYKGFRWNYVENGEDPNVSKIQPTNIKHKPYKISTILKLNSSKSEIIETYPNKIILMDELKISKPTLRKIINNNKLYNQHYYIEYDNCPENLLKKYNKPINKNISPLAKAIKRIDPLTGEITIFNSFNDVYVKTGIPHITIQNAIKDKQVHVKFYWEYA